MQLSKNTSGTALIYAIAISSIVLIIIAGLIGLFVTEARLVGRIDDSARAYYGAESGVEYALRFITRGGTLGSGNQCDDPNELPHTTKVEPTATEAGWRNLNIVRISAPEGLFLRISVDGVFGGSLRKLVFDITPECSITNFQGT